MSCKGPSLSQSHSPWYSFDEASSSQEQLLTFLERSIVDCREKTSYFI